MTATDLASCDADVSQVDDYIDVEEMFCHRDKAETEDGRTYWRKEIVIKALPLADHIAQRFAGRGETQDDLVQVARLALVTAVDRYDPERGRFVAFAVPTIIGEVRKHFRDHTWGTHVPRRYQEVSLSIRDTQERMCQSIGRTPTPNEIATHMGISRDEYDRAQMAHHAYRPMSLDAPASSTEPETSSRQALFGTVDTRYAKVEDLIVLADLVGELSSRERTILRLRFYDGMKQSEIAQRLGISQVHVSRLLTSTLQQLRLAMCSDVLVIVALTVAVCIHC